MDLSNEAANEYDIQLGKQMIRSIKLLLLDKPHESHKFLGEPSLELIPSYDYRFNPEGNLDGFKLNIYDSISQKYEEIMKIIFFPSSLYGETYLAYDYVGTPIPDNHFCKWLGPICENGFNGSGINIKSE